ncbi:hypothetical protein [Lacimicrobium alkaliphilum]|uniref:Uncharacterized protein n=1 Tax=Lacimicrobium alkaliphilum TaxID=1526571 RepID=A0ABQ1RPP6_9ALTE|nr:hypothetical protein [Lacimicrobium alkaliphilum]GGD75338.1 hypothetical protein GCM10011357_32960 [Lacimicrobium alkaliphilum]
MAVDKVLITGAGLRPNGFELGDGKYYEKSIMVSLDLSTGHFTEVLSKKEGGAHYPDEHPNLQYTAACLEGDVLWLPTDTEIYKYSLPDLEIQAVFSHPCFQNVHSVHVFGDDLAVTSTGLDNVVLLDKRSGKVQGILNTEGLDPWHRFSPTTDYRKVHSTKPHHSHPNYVFKLEGKLWVTRCTQGDAVCLSDVNDSIDISDGGAISVHDGLWWGDKLVFTRVDGTLVVCEPETRTVTEKHDPFKAHRNRPNGWCRGLLIEEDIFYIGFSKLRKTNFKSKLKYLSKGNFRYSSGNNSIVVAYDMRNKQVLSIHEAPEGMIDAIYGILPWRY